MLNGFILQIFLQSPCNPCNLMVSVRSHIKDCLSFTALRMRNDKRASFFELYFLNLLLFAGRTGAYLSALYASLRLWKPFQCIWLLMWLFRLTFPCIHLPHTLALAPLMGEGLSALPIALWHWSCAGLLHYPIWLNAGACDSVWTPSSSVHDISLMSTPIYEKQWNLRWRSGQSRSAEASGWGWKKDVSLQWRIWDRRVRIN